MAKSSAEKEPVKITKSGLLKTLGIFSYVKPYLLYFISGMILLVMSTLVFMVIPRLCGELVKVASKSENLGFSLEQLGIALLIILLFQALFSYLRTVSFAIVSEKGMADVRKDLYSKLVTQNVTFFENMRVGDITSRITADVEQLQSAISISLAEFLRQIIILIAGIAYLGFLAPRLSLIMLMTFPVVIVLAVLFGRYIKKLSRNRQALIAEANTVVEESMQNFSIVKAFTNELFENRRYGHSIDDVVDVSLKFARVRGLFFGFIMVFLFGSVLFILWQGAVMVSRNQMETGDLLSFVLYTMVIGGAIAGLGNLYTALAGAIGATERVQEILASDGEFDLEKRPQNLPARLGGDIQFKDLAFSYPSRKDVVVLKDIDIQIPNGSKIALVGQSGSGKSTLIQLLMRFYEPSEGEIVIDDKNIADIDLYQLRSNIGIVPQEVLMFGGTIRENISYGKHKATEEEIIHAAEQSNCMEFIDQFPEGLDTIVGERGIKLSGGQKQRIAIARAILKDPSILILDEATSSLDAESEKLVQEALDRLMVKRTSIIIAHRLATIREVDQIYVIDNGVIKEKGSHAELMQNDAGLYKQLASLQFES